LLALIDTMARKV